MSMTCITITLPARSSVEKIVLLGNGSTQLNPLWLAKLNKHVISGLFSSCLCCPVVSWYLIPWWSRSVHKHLHSWVTFQRMQLDVLYGVNLGIDVVMYLVAHSQKLSIVENVRHLNVSPCEISGSFQWDLHWYWTELK